ncbi:MAG: DUF4292 domain-containing protein [Deltaproteobacteria bacterium]|nr:DUF4292 domain-containing protein [Deltaproteobacteria bacterium]
MRRIVRASAVAAALALVVFASACARTAPPTQLPTPPVRDLAQAMMDRAVAYTASGGVRAGGMLFGFADAEFAVDPRAGVRVDVFTPFMTPAGSLVLTPGGAGFLDRMEGVLVRGDAKTLLDRLLDVPVDPAPLPWILAGGLPPADGGEWTLAKRVPGEPEGAIVLESVNGEGHLRRAVIEGSQFRLTRFSIFQDADPDSETLAVVECEKHREGNLPLPTRLTVRAPSRGATLIVRLDEIRIGQGPTAEDLRIEAPPGVRVRELRN